MPGLTVSVAPQDIKNLETEALVVGFHENVRPLRNLAGQLDWLLCGALSRLIVSHNLRGSVGDAALLTPRGKVPARKIFLVGLGALEDRSAAALSSAAAAVTDVVLKAGVSRAAVEYFAVPGMPFEAAVPAFCSGISSALRGRDLEVTILSPPGAAFQTISHLVTASAPQVRGS